MQSEVRYVTFGSLSGKLMIVKMLICGTINIKEKFNEQKFQNGEKPTSEQFGTMVVKSWTVECRIWDS